MCIIFGMTMSYVILFLSKVSNIWLIRNSFLLYFSIYIYLLMKPSFDSYAAPSIVIFFVIIEYIYERS